MIRLLLAALLLAASPTPSPTLAHSGNLQIEFTAPSPTPRPPLRTLCVDANDLPWPCPTASPSPKPTPWCVTPSGDALTLQCEPQAPARQPSPAIVQACKDAGDEATKWGWDDMGPDARTHRMVLQCDHGTYKATWSPWIWWDKP